MALQGTLRNMEVICQQYIFRSDVPSRCTIRKGYALKQTKFEIAWCEGQETPRHAAAATGLFS